MDHVITDAAQQVESWIVLTQQLDGAIAEVVLSAVVCGHIATGYLLLTK
jgi:hypothetical protein